MILKPLIISIIDYCNEWLYREHWVSGYSQRFRTTFRYKHPIIKEINYEDIINLKTNIE